MFKWLKQYLKLLVNQVKRISINLLKIKMQWNLFNLYLMYLHNQLKKLLIIQIL